MNVKRLFHSFRDAGKGLKFVFKNEQNFRIQILVSIIVLVFAWLFSLSKAEYILLVILIVSVTTLELLNSAVEKFSDVLKPRLSYQIGVIKDIMAAVVLVASLGALVIGILIFWPHFFEFLN